jgi:hypothetical protein
MDKLLLYPSIDEYGQHVFPIDLDRPAAIDGLEKTASNLHPEVQAFIDDFKPMEGHTAFLIDALGSDAYGENVNGDIFPADMLAHKGAYGHKTFEKLAYPYYHHINKGEKYAYGPKVALSVWHEPMERVQLIAYWNDSKCDDIVERILGGEIVDVSMGCKVPYDECTYCGNRAKSRAQYCDHLKHDMRKLMPNGVRVAARNWYPKFFDISRVLRGAEKCSKFLMPVGVSFRRSSIKVASEETDLSAMGSAELFDKVASVTGLEIPAKIAEVKEADIEKNVPSNLTEKELEPAGKILDGMGCLRRSEPDIPKDLLNRMASGHPLKSVLATLLGVGVMPKPHEFQRIILVSIGRRREADDLDEKGHVFDEHAPPPDGHDSSMVRCGPSDISSPIAKMLEPILSGRSAVQPALARRAIVIIKRAEAGIPVIDLEERRRKPVSMGAMMLGLAALHGAFKRHASTQGLAQIGAAARKNPVIFALLASLGVGAVEAHRQIALTGAVPFNQEKTAGLGIMPTLLGLPAAYVYSDLQEAKRRRGERLTWMQDFVRKNPDFTGLGWILGAPAVYASATRGLGKGLPMFKGASLADTALTYGMFQKHLMPLAVTGAAADLLIGNALIKLLAGNKSKSVGPRL